MNEGTNGNDSSSANDSDINEEPEVEELDSSDIGDSIDIDESQVDNSIVDNWSSTIDMHVSITDEISLVMDLLRKIRLLVTLTKKSYIISNFIRTNKLLLKLNKTLNNDCQSRWNSTYILIDSLLKLKTLILKLFTEKKNLNLNKKQVEKLSMIELNNGDWEFLSYMHYVLKPFYLGTVMMSGKNYPSIGLAFHAIQKIKQFCSNDNTSNYHIKELKKLLLTKLDKYFYDDIEQYQYLQVIFYDFHTTYRNSHHKRNFD